MGIFPPEAKSGTDQNSMRIEFTLILRYFSNDNASVRGAFIDAA
jgi:hypothetical protein